MLAYIEGVGLCGPGLGNWEESRPVLAGSIAYRPEPTAIPAGTLLPPAERRRVGVPVRLAIAVGQAAIAAAGLDAAETPTVFTSSGGDCDNVHQICEALALPGHEVSPTRFHNSVHNAAAGYWSIATRCRAASTSLCSYDGSFAAGLLEATAQVAARGRAVALIAYDHPYPPPLSAARKIPAAFGVAMVLAARPSRHAMAALDVDYAPEGMVPAGMHDAALEALRADVPVARCLPLLAVLARSGESTLMLDYGRDACLKLKVSPCK
jgi:hypothetical protein